MGERQEGRGRASDHSGELHEEPDSDTAGSVQPGWRHPGDAAEPVHGTATEGQRVYGGGLPPPSVARPILGEPYHIAPKGATPKQPQPVQAGGWHYREQE
eukprot:4804468-Prorocentrum_lima.AAC.1